MITFYDSTVRLLNVHLEFHQLSVRGNPHCFSFSRCIIINQSLSDSKEFRCNFPVVRMIHFSLFRRGHARRRPCLCTAAWVGVAEAQLDCRATPIVGLLGPLTQALIDVLFVFSTISRFFCYCFQHNTSHHITTMCSAS